MCTNALFGDWAVVGCCVSARNFRIVVEHGQNSVKLCQIVATITAMYGIEIRWSASMRGANEYGISNLNFVTLFDFINTCVSIIPGVWRLIEGEVAQKTNMSTLLQTHPSSWTLLAHAIEQMVTYVTSQPTSNNWDSAQREHSVSDCPFGHERDDSILTSNHQKPQKATLHL